MLLNYINFSAEQNLEKNQYKDEILIDDEEKIYDTKIENWFYLSFKKNELSYILAKDYCQINTIFGYYQINLFQYLALLIFSFLSMFIIEYFIVFCLLAKKQDFEFTYISFILFVGFFLLYFFLIKASIKNNKKFFYKFIEENWGIELELNDMNWQLFWLIINMLYVWEENQDFLMANPEIKIPTYANQKLINHLIFFAYSYNLYEFLEDIISTNLIN